jgi:hypothetical protein
MVAGILPANGFEVKQQAVSIFGEFADWVVSGLRFSRT